MTRGASLPPPGDEAEGNHLAAGIAWRLLDLALVTGVFVLVRIEGQDRPAVQLVFLRALVGLVLIAPLIWRHRADFRTMRQPWRNAGRVSCNAIALSLNFAAIALMPLAMVNAIHFTGPLLAMALAAALLGERIRAPHWAGAALSLAGVAFLVSPGASGFGPLPAAGIAAAFLSVLFGAMATIQTRALRTESVVVMMTFYNAGLTLLTLVPAALAWRPVGNADLLPLVAIGALAQAGQYCFLRAYRVAEAGLLAPVGYVSILFTAAAGWLVFAERPGAGFWIGGAVVLSGVWIIWRADRRERTTDTG